MAKIINFGKIVCTIKKFGDVNCEITKNDFFEEIIKNPQIGEGTCSKSIYKKHIEMCKQLDLVGEENENLVLAKNGLEYYNAIPIENGNKIINKKTDELKAKLVEIIINKSEFIQKQSEKGTIEISTDNGETKFLISVQESKKIDKGFFDLLGELELIAYNNNTYEISEKVGSKILKVHPKPQSEEELLRVLARQREIGKKAEEETVEYEKERLRSLGVKQDLTDRVKRISKDNTRAGFDIESFNGLDVKAGNYDRFIEVKATTGSTPIFYWSENEISVAQNKGDAYFLYIYINFGKNDQRLVTPIKNPYHEIVEKKYERAHPITTWRIIWDEQI